MASLHSRRLPRAQRRPRTTFASPRSRRPRGLAVDHQVAYVRFFAVARGNPRGVAMAERNPHLDPASAVLDEAHVGDIQGAFGTIGQHDVGARTSLKARLLTMLAIMGPGLIVMVGDNDAGGVATYAQAGQNFGLTLLWTLPLLIPVLVVNQEMVVRLGAVTGVGHARLINERFGKFWGAFSVGDLFVLNSASVLLIMAIVGTTVAAWQLCCQQSNIVDKRITPRWINYERLDTVLGSIVTVFAAAVLMAVVAVAFGKTPLAGHFVNAGAVSNGLKKYVGTACLLYTSDAA